MKFVTGEICLNELQRSNFEITVACDNRHKILLHFSFPNFAEGLPCNVQIGGLFVIEDHGYIYNVSKSCSRFQQRNSTSGGDTRQGSSPVFKVSL
jgi:hypothetical protein